MEENLRDPNKYNAENGYVSIDEVLKMNGRKQRHLVDHLKEQDYLEERESYEQVENDIKQARVGTDLAKQAFIKDIKGGLGHQIKNTSGIIIRKRSLGRRIKDFFVNFFTKF